ncbi:spaetzle domain-containing protein [Nephila pilipes]|uniref:Spaetzle domain-containing protein n=1 Tax=Nephila pilipes TaxID=299642 RepID=A0A8X6TFP0_NEPPI|nr:spaetzle domain-containing protein [Nephila pilipes]
MNATFVLLLSSLLMGTSFLQEVSDNDSPAKPKSEASTYLSNHPLLTGATAVRGAAPGCSDQRPSRGQQPYSPDEDDGIGDGFPFGRPRRRPTDGPSLDDRDECQVRFGLHYSSCFSKYKDFDDKFDELQHHVQSLPRGGGGATSPCSTLQLLAKVHSWIQSCDGYLKKKWRHGIINVSDRVKVSAWNSIDWDQQIREVTERKRKSSPIFDRCHGNQYLLRTPYHMYNVKGELRYIVQDPPHLEQCYLEATCSIPSDVCRNYGYGSGRRGGTAGCESRHCHHTLLAWDPSSPDEGTFFDIFEYSCCCNCQATPSQSTRSQLIG